ncbi:MAG: hypothetical protein JW996_06785 [Candidatus Cloacimonetes bacterium]|nr:hypothetical protein [Candidatus Cloacimonadota bacterium]
MQDALKHLNRVLRVYGSFVNNEEGELLAHIMPKGFSVKVLKDTGQQALQGFQGIESSGFAINRVVWDYENYLIISERINGGIVSVLCDKSISMPLLNLTFNLVIKKIESIIESGEFQPVEEEEKPKEKPPVGAETDPKFFDLIEVHLAKFIGPMSTIMVDEAITEMREDRDNFPISKISDLVKVVSKKINNEKKQEEFLALMIDPVDELLKRSKQNED